MNWADCSAVQRDTQRLSGVWLFRGTRVPLAALFDNLQDDVSLTECVDLFTGVTIEQARLALEHAARSAAGSTDGARIT
ncbi:DUF433 domain-containing protein [Vulcanococcus sp.]|jgi:uncharacterized protein (DUF433 family)|uniref:DUF433 domain-containing protein n=1 Tax=Vulcanococcus sp. TaxID=2856995 RepID=UPI0037DA2B01